MEKGADVSYDHEYYEPAAIVSKVLVTPSPMHEPVLESDAINGKYEFSNGAKYSGGLMHGRPHGYGICRYADGTTYIGLFNNTIREGEGELYYTNGRLQYKGGFVDDKREGYGLFYWGSGSKYMGGWKDGQMDGEGEELSPDKRLTKKNSVLYKGCYIKGKREGYGIYNYENGSVYKGEFKLGLKHGVGEFYNTKEKLQYEGSYANGVRSGYGIYYYDDGSKYVGGWKEGVRYGDGEEFNPQGQSIFKGVFENDERSPVLVYDKLSQPGGNQIIISQKPLIPVKSLKSSKSQTELSTSTPASTRHSSKTGTEKVKGWFASVRLNIFQ